MRALLEGVSYPIKLSCIAILGQHRSTFTARRALASGRLRANLNMLTGNDKQLPSKTGYHLRVTDA